MYCWLFQLGGFYFSRLFWDSLHMYEVLCSPECGTGAHPVRHQLYLSTSKMHRNKDLLCKQGGKAAAHRWEGISGSNK